MWFNKKTNTAIDIAQTDPDGALISLQNVWKVYKTDAGDFPALRGINLEIGRSEFVSVIGKSGSGKTTLINMLTGIDRPTDGKISIAGTAIHGLNESNMARWRGLNMGVVFQFFQLLPTISVLQNIMIPMDFCNMYTPAERHDRAMHLLDLVDIADHAHKPPSRLSGGQQQRAAIARALANDPPIIATDEPTGNLDTKTANQIFDLFQQLVDDGKTILMVTHDDDLAKRASRTVIISDGEIVNEYLVQAFPSTSHEILLKATRSLESHSFAPGEPIIQAGDVADQFFIITSGEVHAYLNHPNGSEIFVDALKPGEYFGEVALLKGGERSVMIRASRETPVEVASVNKATFDSLMKECQDLRTNIERSVSKREQTVAEAKNGSN